MMQQAEKPAEGDDKCRCQLLHLFDSLVRTLTVIVRPSRLIRSSSCLIAVLAPFVFSLIVCALLLRVRALFSALTCLLTRFSWLSSWFSWDLPVTFSLMSAL